MKRVTSMLLLVGLILAMLAGCGNSGGQSAQTASSAPTVQESTTQAEAEAPQEPEAAETESAAEPEASTETEPPAEQEEETPEIQPEKSDYDLPLFDETLEFSWFWVNNGASESKEKQNIEFWNELQDQLNIAVTWIQPGSSVASEQYNLMISSGDWADLIWHSGVASEGYSTAYPGGYDAARVRAHGRDPGHLHPAGSSGGHGPSHAGHHRRVDDSFGRPQGKRCGESPVCKQ